MFHCLLADTTHCAMGASYSGRLLFVVNPSWLLLGLPMLVRRCYEQTGRYPRVLLDRIWFSVPFFANLINLLGGVKVTSSCCEMLIEVSVWVDVAYKLKIHTCRPVRQGNRC